MIQLAAPTDVSEATGDAEGNREAMRGAIAHRRSLSALYDGYIRHFSPHALGRTRTGALAVVAFQYGGGRPGGLAAAGQWVCFELVRLLDLRANRDGWSAGSMDSCPFDWLDTCEILT